MNRAKKDNHDNRLQILQIVTETKPLCTEIHKDVAALKDNFEKFMHPRQKLNDMEQEAKKYKMKHEYAKQRVLSVEQQLEQTRQNLKDMEQEAKKYKMELENASQRVNSVEQQLEQTRQKLNDMDQEAKKYTMDYEYPSQRQKLNDMDQEAKKYTMDYEYPSQRQKVNDMEQEAKKYKMKHEYASLRQKLNDMEQEAMKYKIEHEYASQRVNSLEQQLKQTRQKVNDMEQEAKKYKMKHEYARQRQKLNDMEQEAKKYTMDYEYPSQRALSVEQQLEQTRQKLNDMEQEAMKYKMQHEYASQRALSVEQQLEQTRLKYDQKKEEAENWQKTFADFRQRMQYQVANELDCSGARSENIMDPCRESEVGRMYDNMKTQSWGETKEKLWKIYGLQGTELREHAAMLIKKMFEEAVQHVDKIRHDRDDACRVQTATFPKTACLNKITHDYQLFFYYCDLDYYKSVVKEYVSQHCTEHGGVCIDLAAECYKVATLMALHEPQLRPDWDEGWSSYFRSQKLFPAIYKNNCIIFHSE